MPGHHQHAHAHASVQLAEELGKARMASLPPPRKGSFWGNMSAKPALVDKRRQELQEWLFALIRDPVIAHSRVLNTFLELADAARFVQRWAGLTGGCCQTDCCSVWVPFQGIGVGQWMTLSPGYSSTSASRCSGALQDHAGARGCKVLWQTELLQCPTPHLFCCAASRKSPTPLLAAHASG